MSPETIPTIHARGVGDLIEMVPFLVGFTPQESLVIVLIGPDGRVAVTRRLDLADLPGLPSVAAAMLSRYPLSKVALVAYSDSPQPRGSEELMNAPEDFDRFAGQRVRQQLQQVHTLVEAAIERSIQGGFGGVLCVQVGIDYHAVVCEYVPYGVVYWAHLHNLDALPSFIEGLAHLQREGPLMCPDCGHIEAAHRFYSQCLGTLQQPLCGCTKTPTEVAAAHNAALALDFRQQGTKY